MYSRLSCGGILIQLMVGVPERQHVPQMCHAQGFSYGGTYTKSRRGSSRDIAINGLLIHCASVYILMEFFSLDLDGVIRRNSQIHP